MEYERKTIYCPECGRVVAHWDGRSTINVIANCKKCKKRVIYYVETGETVAKRLLERHCSSGKEF